MVGIVPPMPDLCETFVPARPTEIIPFQRLRLLVLLSVAVVVALVFALPENLVLSGTGSGVDLVSLFAPWRAFAAESIQGGHLPLWNPYTFSGGPFLGDFQSAELYPPNLIFIFLPLARAVNLCFLLHLLILGWGMGFWAKWHGYRPAACALCGFFVVLNAPVFTRLYAGHLSVVCTMAWAPWIFLALEKAWRGPVLRPLLLGMAAVGLQILGGHPQFVFYTAFAAGLQALVYSALDPAIRRRALPLAGAVFLGGAAMAAAQLLPGLAAATEGFRQGKVDFSLVRTFPFPVENLLMLFAPGFFGHLSNHTYWGRGYLWESSAFAGAAGLALAGLALGDRERRRGAWADLLVMLPMFLLALGDQTPLLRFFYDYVPGFDKFRVPGRLVFPVLLFGALIIGAGADALIRRRPGSKVFAGVLLLAGIVAVGVGMDIWRQPSLFAGLLQFVQNRQASYGIQETSITDPQLIHTCGVQTGQAVALAGVIFLLAAAGLLLARRWAPWRWLPVALLLGELGWFAYENLDAKNLVITEPAEVSAYLAARPGDYRVLNFMWPNNGYFLGKSDIWGANPTGLKRYAEFINFSQGQDPDQPPEFTSFFSLPPIYALLRLRVAFWPQTGYYQIIETPAVLPHVLLVSNYQVLSGRAAILAALMKADFDARKTVLLESEPVPRPQPQAPPGAARLTDSTSDSLTIEADTPAPALLLITDLYSRDWCARALPGSAQASYEILPADYIVRAIPLAAGHHHLLVEYAPPSFRHGLLISLLAALVWSGLFLRSLCRARDHVAP